ncbi:MAG: pre-peptidase C-terminal domain-containing protein [Candidatus Poribacteria bacterium]|nr:pre-peptidase C-terminal domain-containing protein [Candidatus Poribacteria bacterium]
MGTTVDVSIQGADLDDAHALIIEGEPGITGEVFSAGGEVDTTHQELFEGTCTQCHELRSPNNRSMTPAQWEVTVDRMISEKDAPIDPEDRDKIVSYLKSAARVSGGFSLRLTIAPDAVIGVREIRIVGRHGTSTAWPFELSQQVEGIDTEPNDTIDEATVVPLPLIVNGAIASGGDVDYFQFEANAGDRCVFNVKAYRLNNASQQFFNPTISLFDAGGEELARSNGFYNLDPLIDYPIQVDGTYYLRIRDLLYRGNPAAVYRLTMGVVPYNTYLFPAGGQIGTVIEGVIGGQNLPETSWTIDLTGEQTPGRKQLFTPYGVFPFIASTTSEAIEAEMRGLEETAADMDGGGDIEGEILFQTKCSQCHELRSPSNRALSAEEWETTITRMANKENADISPYERDRITAFVRTEAKRLGDLMAQRIESAQMIDVPGAVSGRVSGSDEVDYYKFTIPEGKTLDPWWVIQPFDNPNETGFDTVYPPEVEIELEETYIGKGGRKLRWYRSRGTGNSVFSNVSEDDVVGYALTYYDADRARTEILSLGSDDGIKVWVNDQLIFSKHIHRAIARAQDVIALPLIKGRNKILIKVENGYGPWGFFATIGGYSMDAFADKLGSPLSPSLTLLNAEGRVLANNAGIGGRRDARIDYSFSEPGTYALRIEDITGQGGASYIYRLSVAPASPDFIIRVTPDNPNVGRGGTVLLTVVATRRVGFTGEVALDVTNLPLGVTASPGAILQDMNEGFITLTADPDAPSGYRVVQVIGSVRTVGGDVIERPASPVEVYRIQNQPLTVQRLSIVVSVTEPPKVALSVSPSHVTITPGGQIPLKVVARRARGSRQEITLTVVGLPSGVRPQRQVTILKGGQTETTLILEPVIVGAGVTVRQNPFIGRELDVRPYNIVVNGSVGQRRVASSPAVQLSIGKN